MIRGLVSILAVAGLATGGVLVAQRVGPEQAKAAVRQAVPLTPAAEVPVCPGPETLQVPEGADAVPAPGPVAVRAVAVANPAAGGAGSSTVDVQGLAAGAATGLGSAPVTAATAGVIIAGPTGAGAVRIATEFSGRVPAVAGEQATLARGGDLRGLSSTGCGTAGADVWLVGGGTTPGRRGRLLVANPGAAPAVVDISIYGPQGLVQVPAGTGLVVAPLTQLALFVDALAPGLGATAVRVQARAGRVAAVLQDSLLNGTVPGGVDDVPPAADPARTQVVPGVAVQAAPAAVGGPAAGSVSVRLVNPEATDAVVRVHLIGPDGTLALPGGGVATVAARSVTDLPVTDVPTGTYAAVVESDTPIVAGAVLTRIGSGPAPASDLAWTAAARPLSALTAVALPALPALPAVTGGQPQPGQQNPVSAELTLAATGRPGRVWLTVLAQDGTRAGSSRVDVPAQHAVTVRLDGSAAGILLQADQAAGPVLGALVLTVADPAGQLISVQPVRPGSAGAPSSLPAAEDPALGLTGGR